MKKSSVFRLGAACLFGVMALQAMRVNGGFIRFDSRTDWTIAAMAMHNYTSVGTVGFDVVLHDDFPITLKYLTIAQFGGDDVVEFTGTDLLIDLDDDTRVKFKFSPVLSAFGFDYAGVDSSVLLDIRPTGGLDPYVFEIPEGDGFFGVLTADATVTFDRARFRLADGADPDAFTLDNAEAFSPVPEPATFVLMSIGLAAVGGGTLWRGRRRSTPENRGEDRDRPLDA